MFDREGRLRSGDGAFEHRSEVITRERRDGHRCQLRPLMRQEGLCCADAPCVIGKPPGGDTSQVLRRFVAGGEREHSTRFFSRLRLR